MKNLNKTIIVVLIGIMFISIPVETYAQRRIVKTKRKVVTVTKLPKGHKTVVHSKTKYYSHKGVYYRKGKSGFTVAHAPVGLRIKTLPKGHVTVRIGGIRYYNYYGTYYRYNPVDKIYFVVEKPTKVDSPNFEEITLIDGETLEGVYLGGNENIIQFEVDGKVIDIPIVKIISMNFAPTLE